MKNLAGCILISLTLGACKPDESRVVAENSVPNKEPQAQNYQLSPPAPTQVSEANWQRELAWVDESMKIDGRTSISTARSLEEAQWLQRHGFLTRSEIDHLRRLGFQRVEQLARAGDRDAILFLGEEMIKDGRGDLVVPALDRLIEKEASIPALHLRARYKTSLVSEVPSEVPTDSWQWREVAFESSNAKIDVASDYFAAYLLGDYRGSQVATRMFAADPAGFPPAIYTEAARKVAQMAKSQSSIKLDPRPMPDDVRGVNE